jgi:hypothetical protein
LADSPAKFDEVVVNANEIKEIPLVARRSIAQVANPTAGFLTINLPGGCKYNRLYGTSQ